MGKEEGMNERETGRETEKRPQPGQTHTDGDTSGYSSLPEGKCVCRGDKIRTGLWKVSNARLTTLDFISTIFCCSNPL